MFRSDALRGQMRRPQSSYLGIIFLLPCNAYYIFLPFRQNFIVGSYYSTNRSKKKCKGFMVTYSNKVLIQKHGHLSILI